MDLSPLPLRTLCAIADRGTFTAAAEELGYTQSSVSRQVAALEREVGARLFDRKQGGPALTAAGQTLLRHARAILAALDAAERDLRGTPAQERRVRLGAFPAAGWALLPRLLATLGRTHPSLTVTSREATSPALLRAVRAGTLDVAVVSSRPPHRPRDTGLPQLTVVDLADLGLRVAVPATGRFAGRGGVTAEELAGQPWIASPQVGAEPLLGVWPGLPGKPRVAHRTRDWLTKLRLVAAGCGVTTVPDGLDLDLPPGVVALPVTGAPPESRRLHAVHLAGSPEVGATVDALRAVLAGSGGSHPRARTAQPG
ncbi:LysR family transcriptional regulator [Actinokineospora bangkokensis]|uniref:LysR family transcriptional regulator n=1 Tax=Actinokineospora bangkokensis TaxID=1193682 RepID=A0A1Q9LKC5_9PSEU|nr:LysR family transcriptional regulator [Actinokineospora bangkokensis]OLR92501.1 LysR family transcriptional regulator [Actinokineospora bangkokensis]